MNIQNSNNVFVFDMDNTLIKTDKANNLAYADAISSVLGKKCSIDFNKRFTRKDLSEKLPTLSKNQIGEIIVCKERCFESYLKETELNQNLFRLLKQLHNEGHYTILLTNCHSGRAISLCNYYRLTEYFVQRFFHEDCLDNKYNLLKFLGYDLQNVVYFENEEDGSSEAVANGINFEKIIKVDF